MTRFKIMKNGQLAFAYGLYRTRAGAQAALEDCFATGEVSACELMGDWIERHGNSYAILVRA